VAPARAQARIIAPKEIAPPIALCIFGIARGHPGRHQEQGLVLRSSADETGYLLSAGNKKAVDHLLRTLPEKFVSSILSQGDGETGGTARTRPCRVRTREIRGRKPEDDG
jgi:hypothetical protein